MKTHLASFVHFYDSGISEEMKLIKIKGAFQCSSDEAKEILEKIKKRESIEIDGKIEHEMKCFGINAHVESFDNIRLNEEKEKQKQIEKESYLKEVELANEWFENIPKEQQRFVEVLGHTKFYCGGAS